MSNEKAIEMAKMFHETYERLAPEHGYETRTETRQFDEGSKNGTLMISVCRELLERNDFLVLVLNNVRK